MQQQNFIIYFLVTWFFIVNYGNAREVEVGVNAAFKPYYFYVYFYEPVGFISFKSMFLKNHKSFNNYRYFIR